MEQQGRVAGVEPAGRCIDGVQHTVRDAARPLKGSELGGVEACHQQLLGDTLLEDAVHGLAHGGGKFARRLFRRAPEHKLQGRLQRAVIEAHVDVRAQFFFQQGGF